MANWHPNPNQDGWIPPLDPNMVLNGRNLRDLVLMAIEAVALGMEPLEAAQTTALQLYDIFSNRLDQYPLDVLIIGTLIHQSRN